MGIKLIKKESMERCDSCGAVMTEYDYDRYGGLCKYCRSKGETKKSEDTSSVNDLLARHNQKWLVKVSYDADASHSAVAPSIVRAATKDAAANIALKRHRGLGDNMKVVSVEPMTESRKKSETAPDEYAKNNFLKGALDYAEIEDDKGNVVILKITKRYANEIGGDFCLRSYDGETDKLLAMGGIRYVVDRFGELLDMDPAEAIIEISKE